MTISCDSKTCTVIPSLTQEDIIHRTSKKRSILTGEPIGFPPLNCLADLAAWVARLEEDLMAEDVMIPRHQWADAAIVYLPKPLNTLMKQQRARRMEASGEDTWIWEGFQIALSRVLEERDSRSGIQNFREDHPLVTTATLAVAGAGLVAAGSFVLAPAIMVGGLNAIGFTASGVAGGSIAAGIQSGVYGGFATGLFSTCQSIGATGAIGSGSTIVSGIGSVVAGLATFSGVQKTTKASDPASDQEKCTKGESTSPPPCYLCQVAEDETQSPSTLSPCYANVPT